MTIRNNLTHFTQQQKSIEKEEDILIHVIIHTKRNC